MKDRRRNVALPLPIAPMDGTVFHAERQDVLPRIARHGEHETVAGRYRARRGIAPESLHPPPLFPGFRVVGDDLAGSHRDDQRSAVSSADQNRRCPARRLGPLYPPANGSRRDVQGSDEGALAPFNVVLDYRETGCGDEHGRGRHSHPHGSDAAEVLGPEGVAAEAEGVKPLGPEPGDDPFPVADRCRVGVRADPVAVVVGESPAPNLPPPAKRAAVTVEGQQHHIQTLIRAEAVRVQELFAPHEMDCGPGFRHALTRNGAGEENQIAHDDGRRMAAALNGRFPEKVLGCSPPERCSGLRVRSAARAAPLGPTRGAGFLS